MPTIVFRNKDTLTSSKLVREKPANTSLFNSHFFPSTSQMDNGLCNLLPSLIYAMLKEWERWHPSGRTAQGLTTDGLTRWRLGISAPSIRMINYHCYVTPWGS